MVFSGYSRRVPNSEFGGSPTGPSNAYLPPNPQFASAFTGVGPGRSGGFGGPALSTTSSTFVGLSAGFGGSPTGPSNAYLPQSRGSTHFEPRSTKFGNQKPSNLETSNFYGAPNFAGPSARPASFEGFSTGSRDVPISGDGIYGRGSSGTYSSSASERNVFAGKGPYGGSPSGTHDGLLSGSNGSGGQRPSGGSAFGSQGSSGKGPSGTYHAPASGGNGFSGQAPDGEKRFGARPLGAYGAPPSSSGGLEDPSRGDIGGPSNVYLPTAGGVGRTSQLSDGIGIHSSVSPSSFHDVPGLGRGYTGSPSGSSNTYLPPGTHGGPGGQGPSINSGFGEQSKYGSEQFSGTYSSSNIGGSSKDPGGFSSSSGSGHFRAYLPPSSSFNNRAPSESGNFGGPKPGGSSFGRVPGSYGAPNALAATGFSASFNGQFNSDTSGIGRRTNGFRGLSSGPSNTYRSPGSGRSSGPSEFERVSSQYGVSNQEGGVFGQGFQDGSNGSHGQQRNSSGRPPNSHGTPSRGNASGRSYDIYSFPSQGQKYNYAFEGYKY